MTDDNELVRYLSTYLANASEDFLMVSFDGYSVYIDRIKLEQCIKNFFENLP